jgi:tRNA A-37 threonylcarbamoyl transferase component Bud32
MGPRTRLAPRHLRIEARLGEGGMGEVYRAFDERLERSLAVKAIRGERRWTAEARARFLREARILSKLDHPHICRLYDLLEVELTDYLLLEYVEGRTLRLAMLDGVGFAEALRIGEQAADALAAAHRLDIVHRDLKPDNVMITAGGEVKILDFGIARSIQDGEADLASVRTAVADEQTARQSPEELRRDALPQTLAFGEALREGGAAGVTFHTSHGSLVGTLTYMSPEQARGEALTAASDLYSLGVVLHELFAGAPAYPEGGAAEDPPARAQAEGASVHVLRSELARLVVELEALDPAARPSAAETRDRLRAIRDKPARRRRRRLATAAGVGVLGLVAAAAALSYGLTRPRVLLAPGERARIALLPFHNATGRGGAGVGRERPHRDGRRDPRRRSRHRRPPGARGARGAQAARPRFRQRDRRPVGGPAPGRARRQPPRRDLDPSAAGRRLRGALRRWSPGRGPNTRPCGERSRRGGEPVGDASCALASTGRQAVDLEGSFSSDPFANRRTPSGSSAGTPSAPRRRGPTTRWRSTAIRVSSGRAIASPRP